MSSLSLSLRFKNWPTWLGGDGGNYKITDVNQDDLDFAFTVWFGGLALVISVIGTGVALAGLHLQDERLHISKEKPIFRNFIRIIKNARHPDIYSTLNIGI